MAETARTTIVLPRALLRRAKMESARSDRTLSQVIAEALEQSLGSEEVPAPVLPVGKYEFGGGRVPDRKAIYEEALRADVSA